MIVGRQSKYKPQVGTQSCLSGSVLVHQNTKLHIDTDMIIVCCLLRWWTCPVPQSLQACCLDAKWTYWRTAATLWRWKSPAGQPGWSWSSSSHSKTPGAAQRSHPERKNKNTIHACPLATLLVLLVCDIRLHSFIQTLFALHKIALELRENARDLGGGVTRSYFVSGIWRIPIKAPCVNVRVSVFRIRCVTKFMQWMPAAGPPPLLRPSYAQFCSSQALHNCPMRAAANTTSWPAEPLYANIRTLYFWTK